MAIEKANAIITSDARIFLLEIFLTALLITPKNVHHKIIERLVTEKELRRMLVYRHKTQTVRVCGYSIRVISLLGYHETS